MLRLVILSILLISSLVGAATTISTEITESSTIKADSEGPTTIEEVSITTNPISEVSYSSTPQSSSSTSSTTENNNSLEINSHENSQEGNSEHEVPLVPIPPRRKVLYINQQQSGKLNVHLELNDVSLIVIPNKKDPQLSLLNLLLRSAQKSNLKHNEIENKKEENAKMNVQQHNHQDDDYSQKYKMDNYMHASTSNEPSIESRAPYHVDISSTLGQQPVVDIINNGKFQSHEEYAKSPPMVKLLKPVQMQPHGRIYKRSIDTSFLRFNPDVLDDKSISQTNDSDEEQQELINSIENNQNLNGVENQEGEEEEDENVDNVASNSGFVLLGAVEDCGPGRRRNSYMICVAIDE